MFHPASHCTLQLTDSINNNNVFCLIINRIFEPDSEKLTSLADFDNCEGRLVEALRRIAQRKVTH